MDHSRNNELPVLLGDLNGKCRSCHGLRLFWDPGFGFGAWDLGLKAGEVNVYVA